MKKLIAIAALASAVVATPALAAGTLTGEVRLGDVRGGAHTDSTELKVEYWGNVYGNVVAGAELQAKQAQNAGAVDAKFSGKIGYNLPEVAGIKTTAYAELGESFKQGNTSEFWGLGIKGSRQVYGPVSVTAGYRHRQGFEYLDNINEERVHAGLTYAISDRTGVGATYYRTRGTTDSDTVGISISQKF
jgi:hypothetical protein